MSIFDIILRPTITARQDVANIRKQKLSMVRLESHPV